MKITNLSNKNDLTSQHSQIDIQNVQLNNSHAQQTVISPTKFKILSFVVIILLVIFIATFSAYFVKQQNYLSSRVKKLEQQQEQINQIKNTLHRSRKQHTKMIAKILRNEQIPKRNFKQATSQDFSSFYCLKKPLVENHLPPKGQRDFLINTRYGFQIYGDAFTGGGEAMTNTIMKEGTFEPETIALMGRLLRPGFNMLNLGVHTGLEAMVAANIVGENGHLYLFQPSNFSNMLIRKSFQLNKFAERATIYKVALSDKKKKSRLFINQDNTGANMLVKESMKLNPNQYEEVQLDLVDNLVPPNVQIDFALVDVERHQVQVFQGMRDVIERSPYLVIMVQWAYGWNPNKDVPKTLDIINFFLDLGYTFYRYQNFDPISCTSGTYKPFKNPLSELLDVEFQNLLIAPSTVILP